jgi:hypothetical protein
MDSEYNKHRDQGIWVEVLAEELAGKRGTLFIWRFTYKTNNNGYIIGFKARLYIRGDLQFPEMEDTYAAMLAARVFRALIAICAYFDLEISWLFNLNPHLHEICFCSEK